MVSAATLECRISKLKKLVKYQNFIKSLKIHQKLLFSGKFFSRKPLFLSIWQWRIFIIKKLQSGNFIRTSKIDQKFKSKNLEKQKVTK